MHIRPTFLILSVASLVLCLSVGVFIFFFKAIENKNQHTSAVLTTLKDKISQKEDTNILVKKIQEVDKIKESVLPHFVDSSRINVFVDGLENLGVDTGTKIKVTDVSVSTNDTNSILVKISINGSFAKVAQTIALLENSRYQVHMTNMYINKHLTAAVLDAKGKVITPESREWQADLSFSVMSI